MVKNPMTHKIGTKGLCEGVGVTQTQNEEIYLDRTVLSGIVVDAVAHSQELYYFLTWNKFNRAIWQESKTGHETHEIKIFLFPRYLPRGKSQKKRERESKKR